MSMENGSWSPAKTPPPPSVRRRQSPRPVLRQPVLPRAAHRVTGSVRPPPPPPAKVEALGNLRMQASWFRVESPKASWQQLQAALGAGGGGTARSSGGGAGGGAGASVAAGGGSVVCPPWTARYSSVQPRLAAVLPAARAATNLCWHTLTQKLKGGGGRVAATGEDDDSTGMMMLDCDFDDGDDSVRRVRMVPEAVEAVLQAVLADDGAGGGEEACARPEGGEAANTLTPRQHALAAIDVVLGLGKQGSSEVSAFVAQRQAAVAAASGGGGGDGDDSGDGGGLAESPHKRAFAVLVALCRGFVVDAAAGSMPLRAAATAMKRVGCAVCAESQPVAERVVFTKEEWSKFVAAFSKLLGRALVKVCVCGGAVWILALLMSDVMVHAQLTLAPLKDAQQGGPQFVATEATVQRVDARFC